MARSASAYFLAFLIILFLGFEYQYQFGRFHDVFHPVYRPGPRKMELGSCKKIQNRTLTNLKINFGVNKTSFQIYHQKDKTVTFNNRPSWLSGKTCD